MDLDAGPRRRTYSMKTAGLLDNTWSTIVFAEILVAHHSRTLGSLLVRCVSSARLASRTSEFSKSATFNALKKKRREKNKKREKRQKTKWKKTKYPHVSKCIIGKKQPPVCAPIFWYPHINPGPPARTSRVQPCTHHLLTGGGIENQYVSSTVLLLRHYVPILIRNHPLLRLSARLQHQRQRARRRHLPQTTGS